MDAKDFLKIAKRLLRYNNEASRRTSIGRSYYGIFNYLKQECYLLGFSIQKGSAGHGQLKNYLHNCEVNEGVDIGSKIGDLYSQRLIADYELGEEVKEQTASLIFEKAEDIVRRFPSIDKAAFKAGVEKYIRVINNARSTPT